MRWVFLAVFVSNVLVWVLIQGYYARVTDQYRDNLIDSQVRLSKMISSKSSCDDLRQRIEHVAYVSKEASVWIDRWQESLELGREVLPASLTLSSKTLDEVIKSSASNMIHATSYHFFAGNALSNWYSWMKPFARDQSLVAFVPTLESLHRTPQEVHVVDMSQASSPLVGKSSLFVLCQRDEGSAIKVSAVMELLRRGRDVMYSDADVIWAKSPLESVVHSVSQDTDLAIQIYNVPTEESLRTGKGIGVNFGLFFLRSNDRTLRFFRGVIKSMTHLIRFTSDNDPLIPSFSFDTCNDQHALQEALFRHHTSSICGWYFNGKYYAQQKDTSKKCIRLTFLHPRDFPTIANLATLTRSYLENPTWSALHFTGFWGGHTFAKIFFAQDNGLWKATSSSSSSSVEDSGRFLQVCNSESEDCTIDDPLVFIGALYAALISKRSLIVPRVSFLFQSQQRIVGSIDSVFHLDSLLRGTRLLQRLSFYTSTPETVPSSLAPLLEVGSPRDGFIVPSSFATTAVSNAPSDVSSDVRVVRLKQNQCPSSTSSASKTFSAPSPNVESAAIEFIKMFVAPSKRFAWDKDFIQRFQMSIS